MDLNHKSQIPIPKSRDLKSQLRFACEYNSHCNSNQKRRLAPRSFAPAKTRKTLFMFLEISTDESLRSYISVVRIPVL